MPAMDRRDVDDGAGATGAHAGHDVFGAQPRALQIDREHRVPFRLSHGGRVEVRVHAGVVHEHVDPAVLAQHLANRPGHVRLAGDVGLDERDRMLWRG
jgi:hypothetical protein